MKLYLFCVITLLIVISFTVNQLRRSQGQILKFHTDNRVLMTETWEVSEKTASKEALGFTTTIHPPDEENIDSKEKEEPKDDNTLFVKPSLMGIDLRPTVISYQKGNDPKKQEKLAALLELDIAVQEAEKKLLSTFGVNTIDEFTALRAAGKVDPLEMADKIFDAHQELQAKFSGNKDILSVIKTFRVMFVLSNERIIRAYFEDPHWYESPKYSKAWKEQSLELLNCLIDSREYDEKNNDELFKNELIKAGLCQAYFFVGRYEDGQRMLNDLLYMGKYGKTSDGKSLIIPDDEQLQKGLFSRCIQDWVLLNDISLIAQGIKTPLERSKWYQDHLEVVDPVLKPEFEVRISEADEWDNAHYFPSEQLKKSLLLKD